MKTNLLSKILPVFLVFNIASFGFAMELDGEKPSQTTQDKTYQPSTLEALCFEAIRPDESTPNKLDQLPTDILEKLALWHDQQQQGNNKLARIAARIVAQRGLMNDGIADIILKSFTKTSFITLFKNTKNFDATFETYFPENILKHGNERLLANKLQSRPNLQYLFCPKLFCNENTDMEQVTIAGNTQHQAMIVNQTLYITFLKSNTAKDYPWFPALKPRQIKNLSVILSEDQKMVMVLSNENKIIFHVDHPNIHLVLASNAEEKFMFDKTGTKIIAHNEDEQPYIYELPMDLLQRNLSLKQAILLPTIERFISQLDPNQAYEGTGIFDLISLLPRPEQFIMEQHFITKATSI